MNRRSPYALLLLAALGGCVSYHKVTSTDVTPRSELVLSFVSPHALTFKAKMGEAVTYVDVVELQGRVISKTADSVTMVGLSATRAQEGRLRFENSTATTLALADVNIREIKNHPGRTVLFIAALGLGAALLIAASQPDPPPPPPPAPKTKSA